jgi:hypothetical protein
MAKHKKNEAIDSEEFKHLGSTQIQDADGNVHLLTLWATLTERLRYCLDIGRLNNSKNELSFWIYPGSLQELTAWFTKLVLRVTKYEVENRGWF